MAPHNKLELLSQGFEYMSVALPKLWKRRIERRAKEAGVKPAVYLRGIITDWYVQDCQKVGEEGEDG